MMYVAFISVNGNPSSSLLASSVSSQCKEWIPLYQQLMWALAFSWNSCFWCSISFRSTSVWLLSAGACLRSWGLFSGFKFSPQILVVPAELCHRVFLSWLLSNGTLFVLVIQCQICHATWADLVFFLASFQQNFFPGLQGWGFLSIPGKIFFPFFFLWQPNSMWLQGKISCLFSGNSRSLFTKRVGHQVQVEEVLLLSLTQQEWISGCVLRMRGFLSPYRVTQVLLLLLHQKQCIFTHALGMRGLISPFQHIKALVL